MKNKKEKSILYLVVLGIIGALIGFIISISTRGFSLESLVTNIESTLVKNSHIIKIIFMVAYNLIGLYYYKKGKEKVNEGLEDDSIIDYRPLEISSNIFSTGVLIVILLDFLVISNLANNLELGIGIRYLNFGLTIIGLIVILFSAYMVKKIVNIYKSVDPMKKGDPYSMSFNKDWIESLDEREQLEIYKASYKSLQYIQYAILVFAVILIVLSAEINLTILPFLILITMTILIFIGTIKK